MTKKSYKVFGQKWSYDNSSQQNIKLPQAKKHDTGIMPYTFNEETLFDTEGFFRHIPVSVLLAIEDEEKIISIINAIRQYDRLYLLFDVIDLTSNAAVADYLLGATKRIIEYIKKHTGRKAILTAFSKDIKPLNALIRRYNRHGG